MEKTFVTMHGLMCGRYFKRKLRKKTEHLLKKATNFFWSPDKDIIIFKTFYKNPKLKLLNGFLITAIPP